MREFTVIRDPKQRLAHINKYLKDDGHPPIEENPNSAYCPLPLTNTPEELKEIVRSRQKTLIEKVLIPAGITPYNPGTAKYSPDIDRTSPPTEVYSADAVKIAGARFFTGHRFLSSGGFGTETQIAKDLNRFAVILFDKNLRITRMQAPATISLQYSNFNREAEKFIPVFEMLKNFEPGIGLNEKNIPILLGFPKGGGEPINLEEKVYRKFPDLRYIYDGNVPVVNLMSKDPRQFYENR